jgi:hypothetical protein
MRPQRFERHVPTARNDRPRQPATRRPGGAAHPNGSPPPYQPDHALSQPMRDHCGNKPSRRRRCDSSTVATLSRNRPSAHRGHQPLRQHAVADTFLALAMLRGDVPKSGWPRWQVTDRATSSSSMGSRPGRLRRPISRWPRYDPSRDVDERCRCGERRRRRERMLFRSGLQNLEPERLRRPVHDGPDVIRRQSLT